MSIKNFIPIIWSDTLLEAMYEDHIFAQPAVVNRNYEGEISGQGDTVNIVGIDPVSIGSYSRYTDIEFQEITDNARKLRITQADYFALRIDDIDKAQAKQNVMQPAMREAGYKMGRNVDVYLATKIAADIDERNVLAPVEYSDPASVEGAEAANGKALRHAFVALRTRLRRNNVPEQGRFAIVSPEIYAMLLEDPHFVETDRRGTTSVVMNGEVGQMYGFTILESNNVPETAADPGATPAVPSSHTIIAGTNMGMSYAEQLSSVEAVRFEKQFGDGVKGLHVYGSKLVRPEALCKIDVTGLPVDAPVVTFRDSGWTDDTIRDAPTPA